ncbi:MAG: hypothetical protein QUV08_02915 [Parasphingorhabdus sp.]|nr:hypothetical protein [Parasphingorhabdus sp.]
MSKPLILIADQLATISQQLSEMSAQYPLEPSLMHLVTDSSFIAAILGAIVGGGITILAQRSQFRREDQKAEMALKTEEIATAETLLYKLSSLCNAFINASNDIKEARDAYGDGEDFWSRYTPPVHNPPRVSLDYRELHLLSKYKQFDILNDYQQALIWMDNLIQSTEVYRSMILDFQTNMPAEMKGNIGSITIDNKNRKEIMPKIVTLRVLSLSIESTITTQAEDVRELFKKYGDAMFDMVGRRPKIEFTDEIDALPDAVV